MNYYGYFLPHYYPNMYLSANRCVSYGPTQQGESAGTSFLPPIQLHNFYSRPLTFIVDNGNNYPDGSGRHVEYHHFYGAPPYSVSPKPFWYMPQAVSTMPYMYHHYKNHVSPLSAVQLQNKNIWPEGFTLKGELRWGVLQRVYGSKRELPDMVKDELRRVYGTYPKSLISITYQNGEYLVKAEPKVGEQDYTIEKKVIRKPSTPSSVEGDSISQVQEKKKKKKSKQ